MAEMIDRNRLLLEIESDENKAADAMQFERYSEMVKRQPAVDAVPVVHGHLVKSKDGYHRCSVCESRGSAIKARYCHHCGAKLDEKEGEVNGQG